MNGREYYLDRVNPKLPRLDAAKEILFTASRFREWKETIRQLIVDNYIPDKPSGKHEIPFETKEMDFGNKTEAINWAISNQLSRRGADDPYIKALLIGWRYANEKQAWGGNRASPQNEDLKTSEKIAAELKVGHATVERAYDLFEAHSLIHNVAPDTAKALESDAIPNRSQDAIIKLGKALRIILESESEI
ncbi:MAG: hypothetical protein MUO26_00145 [Methanotrichaceae archaeon]|nr:hypothetical protein [Methanotrichaceae archaeon]